MPFTPFATGKGRSVQYWTELPLEGGESLQPQAALSDCIALTRVEYEKVLRLVKTFIETAAPPKSTEKFKKVEKQDNLFAFKAHQVRLLGTFLDKNNFGICHCTRKKKMKYREEDLALAQANKQRMLKEWQK